MPTPRTALLDDPQLRPFLPMLWIAWSDFDLETEELAVIARTAAQTPWLRPAARAVLDAWLDPRKPPTRAEVTKLGETLAAVARNLSPERRRDLVELALSLAPEEHRDADMRARLEELESKLAVGPYLGALDAPPPPHAASKVDGVLLASMRAALDGRHGAVRAEVRRFLADPEKRAYGLPPEVYREKVAGWLGELATLGFGNRAFPGVTTAEPNLDAFATTFETLAMGDLSLVVRFGVQFGLFGGSIFFLGTAAQRQEHLPKVAALSLPGCFAMSEAGHGSNVEGLETTATWDPTTRTFAIHTPREAARKEWIGGAAKYARMATVFAQLEANGDAHGVHAFLVPIRDESGAPLPGVRTGDSGLKMGLNGVDNGRLWFDHVRVPETALLGHFATMNAEGAYESRIEGSKKRFFTMLGTLVGGRVSVAAAAVTAAKVGLAIAVRYATTRRQFGPAEGELPLLEYPAHAARLLPRLATVYVHHFAVDRLKAHFAAQITGRLDEEPKDTRELEAEVAALKALTTTSAVETLRECRKACGGQGYLAVNRLPDLCADVEIFTTFEGDNTVLLQLVGKSLLTGFRKRFESGGLGGIARMVLERAKSAVTERNPVEVRRTDAEHLRDRAFHLAALRFREGALLESLARRTKKRIDAKMPPQQAMLEVQEHLLALAGAHADHCALAFFDEAVREVRDPALRATLDRLGALHALTQLRRDAVFYLAEGYFESSKERAMRKEVEKLSAELRPDAVALVDAFGIPDACLSAPIAFMDPAHPKW